MPGILLKFIKFCIVGFTGLIIDFSMTYLLKEKLKVQKYVANAAGFISAASANYFLNRVWTFHSSNPKVFTEYSMFFFVSLVGLGINSFFLWLLVSKFGRKFYLSKLIAIGITTIWNFAANVAVTFV